MRIVDPRPFAIGSIKETFARWPQLQDVLPAMGYDATQLAELGETIDLTPCDVVVAGTPIDLGRLIVTRHPIRRVRYAIEETGPPTIADLLGPIVTQARTRSAAVAR